MNHRARRQLQDHAADLGGAAATYVRGSFLVRFKRGPAILVDGRAAAERGDGGV